MDNNAAGLAAVDDSSDHDEHHRRHVHWNALLPYAVPDGAVMFEEGLRKIKVALEAVDMLALGCCANHFDQYIHQWWASTNFQ